MSIKILLEILRDYPEDWLEFSAGQNTETNLKRFKKKPRLVAGFTQALKYLYLLISHLKLWCVQYSSVDVLYFASTPNQYNVLRPVHNQLTNVKSIFVTPQYLQVGRKTNKHSFVEINFLDFLKVILLFLMRFGYLFRLCFQKPDLVIYRAKSLLSSHMWLIYHDRLLRSVKPKLVILANDHNPECRSLIELCKKQKIRICYIQHAEVSHRFHALDFDVSFLYGQYSLKIYQDCDKRRSPKSKVNPDRYYALVGTMRQFSSDGPQNYKIGTSDVRIGLLIKGTDHLCSILESAEHLSQFGKVIIRPHPNMNFHETKQSLFNALSDNVLLSDPNAESSADYLTRINILLSGNSTMLLEGAMHNIAPFYVRSMSAGVEDYYGFVQENLAIQLSSCLEFNHDTLLMAVNYKPNSAAIKKYIHTYNTENFGSEDMLVSNHIMEILNSDFRNLTAFKP